MENSTHLKLPFILPSQSQKHVTHNEAIVTLDALVQLAVLDRDLSAPPASPDEGDRYIVAGGASGAWQGQEGNVALMQDGAWRFLPPQTGWIAWVADETQAVFWDGNAWRGLTAGLNALQSLSLLGLGTTADAQNPFAAKLNNALWTARGGAEGGSGDLRYVMNKETPADVLSLLLQTGYVARAEIGLVGGDDLTVKVSGDGVRFTEALRINRHSGRAVFRSLQRDGRPGNAVLRDHVAGAPWISSVSGANNNWRSVCWSPELGLFCAVADTGTGNRVMTSPDGIDWTVQASAADNSWMGVCWSPELRLFCAVSFDGVGNRVMTSPDGVNWTAQASAADNLWYSVCWSPELGLFCAVASSGSSNRVMTSPDGFAWTARESAGSGNWFDVCWAAELGLFCAVSSGGSGERVMTSPDGAAWTLHPAAVDNKWRAVCWSPELELFCAVADGGTGDRVMTSPDGANWTACTGIPDELWYDVTWSPELGLFCAVASSGSGNRVMTSPDGFSWTAGQSAADNSWFGVEWSPELGLFCAVSLTGSGDRAMTSRSAWSYPYRSG